MCTRVLGNTHIHTLSDWAGTSPCISNDASRRQKTQGGTTWLAICRAWTMWSICTWSITHSVFNICSWQRGHKHTWAGSYSEAQNYSCDIICDGWKASYISRLRFSIWADRGKMFTFILVREFKDYFSFDLLGVSIILAVTVCSFLLLLWWAGLRQNQNAAWRTEF